MSTLKKTYHIITIGCQMNKSDSERMAGYLEMHGYSPSDERGEAGLVVVNTCGVRQSAEDRAYGLVTKIKQENHKVKIILTGCLSEREDVIKKLRDRVDIWLPIVELPALSERLGIEEMQGDASDRRGYLDILPRYDSGLSAFVPIGNGCNNFCAYCVVPYARGREIYREAEEIVNEVRGLVDKGYKEINLIAQNVNSYRYDANAANGKRPPSQKLGRVKMTRIANKANSVIEFPELLRMVNKIPGDFWIRFATSHPKDMSDELINTIAECDKVCEHVHLPVQAGDDGVLRNMNRNYTVEQYKKLVNKIKNFTRMDTDKRRINTNKSDVRDLWRAPVAISTDVIVGFPGETEEQFNNTVGLFKEIKFDMAYIAQYSPRPGTAAAKLEDDVPKEEKRRREHILTQVLSETALENNKRYLDKTVVVLVEGKNRKGEWYGRTITGKKCGMRETEGGIGSGQFVTVKIDKVWDFGLGGVLVN